MSYNSDGVSVTFRPLYEPKNMLDGLKINPPNVKVVEGVRGYAADYFALSSNISSKASFRRSNIQSSPPL